MESRSSDIGVDDEPDENSVAMVRRRDVMRSSEADLVGMSSREARVFRNVHNGHA